MKKLLLRLLTGIVIAAILLGVAAWLALLGSLPELDGELDVDGLAGAVTIERDANGIPAITASNRRDLAFATGFVHGQDRFFQMDLIRRQAAGELAELFGAVAVNADKRNRFHRFRGRAQVVWEQTPAAERDLMEAYTAGVNAGLGSLDARPWEYLVLRLEPEPWQPQDSLLAMYSMYMTLNDARASNEVRRGLAHRVLPETVYRWMYPTGTPWDAPIVGEPRAALPVPGPEEYSLRDIDVEAPPVRETGRYPLRGSNNWAVAGSLTETGRALVANDMHLGHRNPNIWYRARLIVAGPDAMEVAGVTLPGGPFVVSGTNTHVAWGYTNSYGDWVDAVLLRPGAKADTYRTPEGDLEFDVHVEMIEVRDGEPVEYEIRETIWGPILDDIDYPDGEIAVSWIAHKPEGINFRLFDIEHATTVFEALDIANTIAMPPQNFVAGDADGNIGWTIAGTIPRKASFDPMLPADWSEEHGWQGWYAPEQYPRIVNPESGRIWTANARVVDGEALAIIGDGGYDLGARARQIRDGLFARERLAPEDMLAIQYDDRALYLTPWRELLLEVLSDAAVAGDPGLTEYRELVENWIPRAAPESVGYRLVRAFRLEVESRVFNALMAPARAAYGDDVRLRLSNQFEAALWSVVTQRPLHLLPSGYADWDEFLLAAVRENLRYFREEFDGPLSDRTWGERNMASIRHPLSGSIPLLGRFLDMPAEPLNGDLDMPKAQGPSFGASERYAVSPGDEQHGVLHMPTGQTAHPLSEFFGRGHRDWVTGSPSPFLPGLPAHTLTLTPDSR